jgi:hypothetical protein
MHHALHLSQWMNRAIPGPWPRQSGLLHPVSRKLNFWILAKGWLVVKVPSTLQSVTVTRPPGHCPCGVKVKICMCTVCMQHLNTSRGCLAHKSRNRLLRERRTCRFVFTVQSLCIPLGQCRAFVGLVLLSPNISPACAKPRRLRDLQSPISSRDSAVCLYSPALAVITCCVVAMGGPISRAVTSDSFILPLTQTASQSSTAQHNPGPARSFRRLGRRTRPE